MMNISLKGLSFQSSIFNFTSPLTPLPSSMTMRHGSMKFSIFNLQFSTYFCIFAVRMITASIVTYNHNILDIEAVLRSLMTSPVSTVYIIDHSDEMLKLEGELETFRNEEPLYDEHKRRGFNIIYMRHENNGYGGGHNVAVRLAAQMGSTYHLVVNPDVWFKPDVIPAIWHCMEQDPSIGQIMPHVKYLDGKVQRIAKLLPTPMNLFERFFLPARIVSKHNDKFELRHTNYTMTLNVPYLSGCFMFFRMSALQEVGLFDEHFFMYAEDIDITRRIHRKYKTLFFPEVSIYHKFNRASHRSLRLFRIHLVNIIKYFNKWGWVYDNERRTFNKRLLAEIEELKNHHEQ